MHGTISALPNMSSWSGAYTEGWLYLTASIQYIACSEWVSVFMKRTYSRLCYQTLLWLWFILLSLDIFSSLQLPLLLEQTTAQICCIWKSNPYWNIHAVWSL